MLNYRRDYWVYFLSSIPTGEGDREEVSQRWADMSVHAEPRRLVRRESPTWVSQTSPLSPRRKTFPLECKTSVPELTSSLWGSKHASASVTIHDHPWLCFLIWPSASKTLLFVASTHTAYEHMCHWYIQHLHILCWLQHQLCSNCTVPLPWGAGIHTQNLIEHCGIWIWLFIIPSEAL